MSEQDTRRSRFFWTYASGARDLLIYAVFPLLFAGLLAIPVFLEMTPPENKWLFPLCFWPLVALGLVLVLAGMIEIRRISALLARGSICAGVVSELERRSPFYARYGRTKIYGIFVFQTPEGQRSGRIAAWSYDERYNWLKKGLVVRVISDGRRSLLLLPQDDLR